MNRRERPAVDRATALLAASVLLVFAGCSTDSTPLTFLSIGTGGTGGIYYPLGGALAANLSLADPTRRYTAEVTGGSVENINRIADGEIDLGFSMSTTVEAAYNGSNDSRRPLAELRIVAPLYPNVAHVLVRAGLAASSLAELRGRRVSVGSAGSGTEQFARQLLAAAGLDYTQVSERFLSFSESSSALRDGAIDAAIFSVGYPASAVLEATTNASIRLLPVDGEALAELLQRYPSYRKASIPAGTYPGMKEDLPTVAMLNWIVARDSLDGTVVRLLLDILLEKRQALVRVNEIARQIDLDALRSAPIPLHPAARSWIDEHKP
ncbi:MAG: TAXI family TRAP transporter solute-binding subunit [Acidobacteriota bacterium]